jgi:acyl carrier protein
MTTSTGWGDDIGEGKSVMTTLQRLQDLLVKRFDLERKDLDPAASLEQLGLDSMGTIDLMFQVEDEFGVTFPRDADAPKTLQDVLDCIDRLLADPAAAVDSDRGPVP